eukprot:TCALIF_04904-PA protein Name:"Protein of unknown function" AED:0.48 eAED:0.48 QI:0/0/0.25/0.5/1/1/4/112/132
MEKYGRNMKMFVDALCLETYPAKSLKFWTFFQPMGTRFKTVCHGLGKHEDQEIAEFSFQDLKAISDALGEKHFFLGDTPKQTYVQLPQFLHGTFGTKRRLRSSTWLPRLNGEVEQHYMHDAFAEMQPTQREL